MALVLRYIGNFFYTYMYENTDERVKHFPMMGSAAWIYLIVGGYFLFVKYLGPRLMKHRPGFELKGILIAYNSIQMIANFCLAVYSIKHSYAKPDWSLWCQPYLPTQNLPSDRIYAFCAYSYFLLKFADLLDTVFFVLRKKDKQITFLHLYHHSMMALCSYYAVKNLIMGHVALMPIINMFVHSIMYAYYLVTCIRPKLKQSLWWKKHITQVQLLQFFLLFIHFGRPLLTQDCPYPISIMAMCFMQNLFMIVMFSDFYRRAYLQKKVKHTL